MAGMGGATMRIAAMGLVLTVAPGCSWMFVNKPPPAPVPPTPPVVCTSSVASPVLDTVGTVLLGAAGVTTIVATASWNTQGWFAMNSTGKVVGVIAGVAMVGGATALGFSAAHGYGTTSDCANRKEAQLACVSGVEAACRALESGAEWTAPRGPRERCRVDEDCRDGLVCHLEHCVPRAP